MAPRTVSRSFAGGEMSPEMHGRIDDVKFQNGAKRLRNMVSKAQGPAVRRPGSGWVGASPDPSNRSRLIDFVYSTDQTVVLQLGRHTVDGRSIGFIRFHTLGGTQLFTTPRTYVRPQSFLPAALDLIAETITFAQPHFLETGDEIVFTKSAPGATLFSVNSVVVPEFASWFAIRISSTVIQITSSVALAKGGTALGLTNAGTVGGGEDFKMHRAYRPGDLIRDTPATSNAGGNGDFYCMAPPWLIHADHPPTDTDYWVREPGAMVAAAMVYEVPHFWSDADLFDLNPGCQSADVLTIVHPHYRPMELRRFSATKWTLEEPLFAATLAAPTGLAGVPTGGGASEIDSSNNTTAQLTLANIHEFLAGQSVYVNGVPSAGGIDLPNDFYIVRAPTAAVAPGTVTYLELRSVSRGTATPIPTNASITNNTAFVRAASLNSDLVQAYVVTAVDQAGAESLPTAAVFVTNLLSVTGSYNTLSWAAVAGAKRYRVYKANTAYDAGGGTFAVRGLYGLVGEVDAAAATSFVDDDIEPDFSRTPSIFDPDLQVVQTVTFDTTNDLVLCANHGLVAGAPVLFVTNGSLPGLTQGKTYFVVNPSRDAYQVALVPDGAAEALNAGSGTHSARSGAWPGAVGYHQGRRHFAGSRMRPQEGWATRSGTESDLTYHAPVQADDRLQYRLNTRKVSTIRHVVPFGDLLLLTNSCEIRLVPESGATLKPGAIDAQTDTYVGSSRVKPLVCTHAILFAAARGGHLYEGGFQNQNGKFTAGSISIRAGHLFEGEEIVQLAFQQAPLQIAWAVSSSGRLLALTYVPEEQVGAWAWMDTDGAFESVAVVAEGSEDRVYVMVRRTVDGETVRYLERLAPFNFGELLEDAFFVDAGLSFDGTNTNPALTVTISGSTSWGFGQVVTLTAAAPGIFQFPATTDVGDQVRVTAADGSVHVIEITGTTSAQVATGKLRSQTLPADLRGVATAAWAWARDTFSGFDHLEGKTVKILADGVVQTPQVVEDGTITLTPMVKVHAGLGFTSDLLTLPPTLQVNGFGQGRTKNVNKAWLDVVESGAFKVGIEKDGVPDVKPARGPDGRQLDATELHTLQAEALVPGNWSDDVPILVRQEDPLPLNITSLVLEVAVGG